MNFCSMPPDNFQLSLPALVQCLLKASMNALQFANSVSRGSLSFSTVTQAISDLVSLPSDVLFVTRYIEIGGDHAAIAEDNILG